MGGRGSLPRIWGPAAELHFPPQRGRRLLPAFRAFLGRPAGLCVSPGGASTPARSDLGAPAGLFLLRPGPLEEASVRAGVSRPRSTSWGWGLSQPPEPGAHPRAPLSYLARVSFLPGPPPPF